MIWVWSAWALWVFVALFTLVQWSITFSHSDRGVRILAGRAAFLLSAALGVTAFTTFPKWHLLWMAPLAYFGSTMVSIMLMSRNAERSLKAWRRNEIATWNPAMVPVVGEDVAWKEIVRQVLHVLEFDRGETIINPDGSLKRASLMEPDGHLLVKSPIFYRPIKVPIVHRDDFLLARIAFDHPELGELIHDDELLVTYAPRRTWLGGRTASLKHCMHYVICPKGTLKAYYEFDGGVHKTEPNPERLFGPLVWDGVAEVRHNLSPNLG